jgi:ATP/maltotriose-dependent transcriptional regulator MalT
MGKRNYRYYSAEQLTEEELQIPHNAKQTILVLDDLHLLRTDELGQNLQNEIILLAAREDVWLILSGRSRMPSWLIPVYYRRMFTVIEEADFLLSDTELAEYFTLWGLNLPEEDFRKIIQLVSGVGIVARLIAMELVLQARMILTAISPRLAISTRSNTDGLLEAAQAAVLPLQPILGFSLVCLDHKKRLPILDRLSVLC